MQTATANIFSEKHRQRLDSALAELKNLLLTPRTYGVARSLVAEYLTESPFGSRSQAELKERIHDPEVLKELPIFWPHLKRDFRTIVTTAEEIDPVEVAMAFFEKGYLCFHTALFWNGLSNQVPANFFVATERKNPPKPRAGAEIDDFLLREAFMKPPRETRKIGNFQKYRFALIEREHTDFLGVVEKKTTVSGRTLTVRHTDPERTLLDAAMHPHRAGGILNVIEAFRAAPGKQMRIKKLIQYYEKLAPVYPYWQRVGLIFKLSKNQKTTGIWKSHFGKPSGLFFLDRPYKVNWPVDQDWNVAYPKGVGE